MRFVCFCCVKALRSPKFSRGLRPCCCCCCCRLQAVGWMRCDAIRIGIARIPRTLLVRRLRHAATYLVLDGTRETITDNESGPPFNAAGTSASLCSVTLRVVTIHDCAINRRVETDSKPSLYYLPVLFCPWCHIPGINANPHSASLSDGSFARWYRSLWRRDWQRYQRLPAVYVLL